MRALRVLGMAEDGANLVCEEPVSGDQYAIPADERLRAAARGDVSRLGQLEIEMEPQLRPREIQARVRAGASIEQVAALAACDPARVERFAYPVLMERGAIAEQARKARPITAGVLADRSIEAMVTEILHTRGHSGTLNWDAYREDGAGWVLKLSWKVGRSENSARWSFTPGAAGGSVAAADDAATELMDPAPRPLRTVRDLAAEAPAAPRPPQNPLVLTPEPTKVEASAVLLEPAVAASSGVEAGVAEPKNRMAAALAPPVGPGASKAPVEKSAAAAPSAPEPAATKSPATTAPAKTAPAKTAPAKTAPAKAQGKQGKRPAMPSWEDVLLGVRSSNR